MLCDREGVDGFGNLLLYRCHRADRGPSRLIYNQDSSRSQIDVQAPVYDIRGAFKGTNAASRFWAGAPIRQHITATCTTSHRPPGPASAIPSVTGIA
jgi:hypothetical protein